MYSIRNNVKVMIAGAAFGVAAAAGCQRIVPQPVRSPVNDTPLVVDEAMQIREFDRNTAYYANGATVAGGTGYVWQTHEAVKPEHRRYTDAPVAVLNIVSMPVGLFVNSPWEAQVLRGETVPPTYTGQPPLPGRPAGANGSGVEVIDTPGQMEELVPPPADGSLPPAPPPAPPVETTPPAPPASEVTPVAPPVEPVAPTPPAAPESATPPTPPAAPETPAAPAPVTPPAPEPIAPDSTPTTPAPVTPGAIESVPPATPPVAPPPAPAPAPEAVPPSTTPLNK